MSASAKKKLRKEENAVQLTEKQLQAQKEAKKLKAYTTIFVAAIAVVLVVALVIAGTTFYSNSGIKESKTIAAVVDGHEINSVEMSYYYADTLNNNYTRWSETYGENMSLYLSLMGLDLTQPLGDQEYIDGSTWADYFIDTAISSAQSDQILYEKAVAEGFTMTQETKDMLESTFSNMEMYAIVYGYSDVDSYMHAVYGPGADLDSYRAYAEKSALASDYYNAYSENLVIDDAAIRAYEADKYDKYSSFSYASYNLNYNYFLTGGTTDAEGNVTYTDEEKDAARLAAKTAAESLPQCATVEELNAAIANLKLGESAAAEATVYTNNLYAYCSSNIQDWLAGSNRKAGDFTVVENVSTTADDAGVETSAVSGYTAYVFIDRNDNTDLMSNVRHILVGFEGGTTDENGSTTYSDEEKAATKKEAERILSLYETGEKTEESFAALATSNSADTGSASNGGLIEDIAEGEGLYVEPFATWSVDPARVPGDTGIIETVYGYHVMYYVGDDEMSYRDSMIHDEIHTNSVSEWYEGLLNSSVLEIKDTSLLNRNIVLSK